MGTLPDTQPPPRRQHTHRTLNLPEGMSDDMLAWACGVSRSSIYRWKAGSAMSDMGNLAVALFRHLGKEKFVESMKEIRRTDPPETAGRPRAANIQRMILDILKHSDGPVSSHFIEEILAIEYGKYPTPASIRTMLSKLKGQGEIINVGLNQYVLADQDGQRTVMPSGPDANGQEREQTEPAGPETQTCSGPSEPGGEITSESSP